MVSTRSQTRTRKAKLALYRSRVKSSRCRGKSKNRCYKKNGCKNTIKGLRKSYCRKSRNSHV